jgi:acylphosphatase
LGLESWVLGLKTMTGKHIIFIGHVQGVGFRYNARAIARGFNLTGFVRNVPDGSVEMLAQGAPEDITICIEEIEQYFGGHIRRKEVQDVPYDPRYSAFEIG